MSTHHHQHPHHRHKTVDHPRTDDAAFLARFGSGAAGLPPGPFVEGYRIAGYADGLVGASPECAVLKPHWDSGIKFGDGTPNPEAPCWGRGVAGGVKWDGTFWRDLARFSSAGALFWSAYLKPGTGPGMKNGYWLNFGSGWSHLHNDEPAQILGGASQKLFYVGPVTPPGGSAGSGDPADNGQWQLVIEATMFVTHAVVDVWTGTKAGGNDPTGTYTRVSGLDPLATLTIEAVP